MTGAATDRVAVVVNGNAKGVSEELVGVLDQIVQSGDLFVSRDLDEGRDIAVRIVERGYPTVLTGGGDGTFTQMVTWICREADRRSIEPPRFGLLKLGTGNALAWVLGAQDGVVADLGRLRKEGGSRGLRLVEVEEMIAPFAGVGVDAMALGDFHRVRSVMRRIPVLRRVGTGGLSYAISLPGLSLPKVLTWPHHPVRIINLGEPAVRLGVDGQPVGEPTAAGDVIYEGPMRGVWVSTVPYWGFGSRIFPFAEDREDRFNLRVVDLTSLDVAWNIRSIWKGTYRDDRLHDFLVDHIRVELQRPLPFQIGGDAHGERQTFDVRLSREIRVVDYYAPPPVE
ncbi:MAG: diacylglycerol kinase family protein [Myxococcota bacterium]